MPKASSNAGLHYYLRSDYGHLFEKMKPNSDNMPLLPQDQVKIKSNVIKTEYKDEKGKDLYFKDVVEYDGETYSVDYDGKQFKWVIKSKTKVYMLRDVYKKLVLVKKYEFR